MTRLINADALMEKSFEIEYADGWHKSVTKEVVSVKDINNAPTIELSGDIISKAEVLALINKAMYNTDNKEIQDYIFCGLRRDVHNLSSVDRPKGELVVENHEVVCSVCGQNNLETNFCPNCGADMRGDVM